MTTRRDFLATIAATAAYGAVPAGIGALEAGDSKAGAVFALKNQSRGAERNILDMTTAEVFERLNSGLKGKGLDDHSTRALVMASLARKPKPSCEVHENNTPAAFCGHATFRYRWLRQSTGWATWQDCPSPWYCVCGHAIVPEARCETCEGKEYVRAYTEAWAGAQNALVPSPRLVPCPTCCEPDYDAWVEAGIVEHGGPTAVSFFTP